MASSSCVTDDPQFIWDLYLIKNPFGWLSRCPTEYRSPGSWKTLLINRPDLWIFHCPVDQYYQGGWNHIKRILPESWKRYCPAKYRSARSTCQRRPFVFPAVPVAPPLPTETTVTATTAATTASTPVVESAPFEVVEPEPDNGNPTDVFN